MRKSVHAWNVESSIDTPFQAEQGCTIYRLRNIGYGYERCLISSCHWQEIKSATVNKSGLENADIIVAYIPYDSTVVQFTSDDKSKETTIQGLYPIIDVDHSKASQDIIVKGPCDFIFDNSSEKSASDSYKRFIDIYETHTVKNIERFFYGPQDLWHIKITAR
jgi:hypothetical protein